MSEQDSWDFSLQIEGRPPLHPLSLFLLLLTPSLPEPVCIRPGPWIWIGRQPEPLAGFGHRSILGNSLPQKGNHASSPFIQCWAASVSDHLLVRTLCAPFLPHGGRWLPR